MKFSEAKIDIALHLKSGNSVFCWGAPGIGKSTLFQEIANEEYDGHLIDVRASQLDAVDTRGIPSVKDGVTRWNPPDWLPDERRHGDKGILLFDEMNAAPMSVQVALYQLMIPPHRLGDYQLPSGWRVAGAGNRQQDKAGAQRMSSALASRMVHVDLDPDASDWIAWAAGAGIEPVLIAFIAWRREALLHNMEATEDMRTYACPRTWEMCSKILPARRRSMAESCVGRTATAELWGFLKIWEELPRPEEIEAKPATCKLPQEPSAIYAVAALVARTMTRANAGKLCEYLDRLPVEFQVMAMMQAIKRDPSLKTTKPFVAWAVKNQHVSL